jgi:predicted  nucleic acid-binding Zn-ribbon protein
MLTRLRWFIAVWISPELDKASDDWYNWWMKSMESESQLEGEVYTLKETLSELYEQIADLQELVRDLEEDPLARAG